MKILNVICPLSFHLFVVVTIGEQGELDGLMLQNPHLMHSRQQRHFTTQPHSHSSGIQLPQPMQQSHYHRQEQHSHPSHSQQQHLGSGTTDLQSEYTSIVLCHVSLGVAHINMNILEMSFKTHSPMAS